MTSSRIAFLRRTLFIGGMLLLLSSTAGRGQNVSESENRSAWALYQAGKIPIVVALADDMPFPDSEAVIVRSRQGPPHDAIVLHASSSSLALAIDALFTLHFVHTELDSACPTSDAVIRVHHGNTKQPFDWTEGDRNRFRGVLKRLQQKPAEAIDQKEGLFVEGFERVRVDTIWITRYWNGPEESIPRGEITGVCQNTKQ